jgi:crotonobetainyl-CoA:carnitine CoA-transferase CaiB-like acyl-CoA transferase
VDTEAGAIDALLPPGAADAASVRMDAIPALGAHTDALLRELGYDDMAISAWRRDGVV